MAKNNPAVLPLVHRPLPPMLCRLQGGFFLAAGRGALLGSRLVLVASKVDPNPLCPEKSSGMGGEQWRLGMSISLGRKRSMARMEKKMSVSIEK
jgi:hypothetical protein